MAFGLMEYALRNLGVSQYRTEVTVQKFRTAEYGGGASVMTISRQGAARPNYVSTVRPNRSSRAERGLNDFPGCPLYRSS
jgi:hypothetical protein